MKDLVKVGHLLLLFVLVVFMIQNIDSTTVRFLNYSFSASKILFIPGMFLAGLLMGWGSSMLYHSKLPDFRNPFKGKKEARHRPLFDHNVKDLSHAKRQ